tara:strand:+ start:3947 stop:4306 length:360 start_codon:yes stop_codon:yes gene_type:complete
MRTNKNYTAETVLELTKDFPLEPMFTRVIVTLNQIVQDGELVLASNALDEEQFVVSVGGTAQVKPGQKILLDLTKLTKKIPDPTNTHTTIDSIFIETLTVDEVVYGIIYDNQIKCKFTK